MDRRVNGGAVKLSRLQQSGNLIIICIYPSSSKETPLKYLCEKTDLREGMSRGFDVDGVRLLAVRRAGQVYTYQNRCPHRNVPLEWHPDQFLDASASLIQCATHGALFVIESGECIAGPCEGKFLSTVECREDAQGVWINLPIQD